MTACDCIKKIEERLSEQVRVNVMVEICKKCKGEGILNKETGEPVDYFGTWRGDGTAVVICDACDGKLVVWEHYCPECQGDE